MTGLKMITPSTMILSNLSSTQSPKTSPPQHTVTKEITHNLYPKSVLRLTYPSRDHLRANTFTKEIFIKLLTEKVVKQFKRRLVAASKFSWERLLTYYWCKTIPICSRLQWS